MFSFSGFFLQSKIFAAKVEIRRVFRGPKQLQNKIVIVENLGNPKICKANRKVKDTRIFFANSLKLDRQNFLSADDPKMPHFHLRSSLLRLTLSNLKVLWKLQKQEGIKQKKGKSVSFYQTFKEYFLTCLVFFRIFIWHCLVASNYKWKIGQIFETFSEYLNFNYWNNLFLKSSLQNSRRSATQ